VSKDGARRDRRASAISSPSKSKRTYSTPDTPAERWSRLYVDVRAGCGRAAIKVALFLYRGVAAHFGHVR
jgi:hypothetical protein